MARTSLRPLLLASACCLLALSGPNTEAAAKRPVAQKQHRTSKPQSKRAKRQAARTQLAAAKITRSQLSRVWLCHRPLEKRHDSRCVKLGQLSAHHKGIAGHLGSEALAAVVDMSKLGGADWLQRSASSPRLLGCGGLDSARGATYLSAANQVGRRGWTGRGKGVDRKVARDCPRGGKTTLLAGATASWWAETVTAEAYGDAFEDYSSECDEQGPGKRGGRPKPMDGDAPSPGPSGGAPDNGPGTGTPSPTPKGGVPDAQPSRQPKPTNKGKPSKHHAKRYKDPRTKSQKLYDEVEDFFGRLNGRVVESEDGKITQAGPGTRGDCIDPLSCGPDSCQAKAQARALAKTMNKFRYDGCNDDVRPTPDGPNTCVNLVKGGGVDDDFMALLKKEMCERQGWVASVDEHMQPECVPFDEAQGGYPKLGCDDPAAMCSEAQAPATGQVPSTRPRRKKGPGPVGPGGLPGHKPASGKLPSNP